MTNQQSLPIVNTLFLLVILGKEDNMYKFRWVCNDSLSKTHAPACILCMLEDAAAYHSTLDYRLSNVYEQLTY